MIDRYDITIESIDWDQTELLEEKDPDGDWVQFEDIPQWVKCSDRLPKEIIEPVLVARNKGNRCVMEAFLIDGKFMTYRLGNASEFINPTHWQPLPTPPEAEK